MRLKVTRLHAITRAASWATRPGGHPVRAQPARWQADPRLPSGVARMVVAELRLTKLRVPELGVAELGLLTMAGPTMVEAVRVEAGPARAVQGLWAGLAQRAVPTAGIVRPTALVKAGARRRSWLAERAADLLAAESSWIGTDRLVTAAWVRAPVLLCLGGQALRLLAMVLRAHGRPFR